MVKNGTYLHFSTFLYFGVYVNNSCFVTLNVTLNLIKL
nr:MAG TPA: hypothetical protein [Caudoviricetes sp.]